jgi:hypothetical protein
VTFLDICESYEVLCNIKRDDCFSNNERESIFLLLNKCTEGSWVSKCHQNPSITACIISCIATKLAASTTPGTFSGWFTMIISNYVSYFPFSLKRTCFCERGTVGNKPEQNRDI